VRTTSNIPALGARAVTLGRGWVVVEGCCLILLGKGAAPGWVWGLVSLTVDRMTTRHGLSSSRTDPVPAGG